MYAIRIQELIFVYHYDTNLLWWKFITIMQICHPQDENGFYDKNLSSWLELIRWKLIIFWKVLYCDKCASI